MDSMRDPEKSRDVENGTIETGSTAYQSDVDVEKTEHRKDGEGAIGEPDSDHEEVEQMDRWHLEDLERQHVGFPPKTQHLFGQSARNHSPMLEHLLTPLDRCVDQSWPSKRQKRSPTSNDKI